MSKPKLSLPSNKISTKISNWLTNLSFTISVQNMKCGRETETDFYKRTWILGQCDNCKIVNISNDLKNYLPNVQAKNVHYYVFKQLRHSTTIRGKLVSYMCAAWVDKHDPVETIISKLQVMAEKYLLHRFLRSMIKRTGKSFSKRHSTTDFG